MSCYICHKVDSKRCTRCFQIAYCGVQCQKQDWEYHKNTCKQNPLNVVDMLIRSGNYHDLIHNIFQHVFHSLSGRDMHNFRNVCRSWRDIALAVAKLKNSKHDWEKKLVRQWQTGSPTAKTVFKHNAEITKIVVSGNDIFFDVLGQPVIKVYDVSTYKFRYSIRAASGKESCWDVFSILVK